jgi:ribosome maturation factor RimP
MSLQDLIFDSIVPITQEQGVYLEEVTVVRAGKRQLVTVIIDGESGLSLDEVTSVTKAISNRLDELVELGDAPFTLEVTSPGIDRPLTQARHWRKNANRLVKVTLNEGGEVTGRIGELTDESVMVGEQSILLRDIKRAQVQIEFKKLEA